MRALLKIELSRAFKNKMLFVGLAIGVGICVWHIVGVVIPRSTDMCWVKFEEMEYPASIFNCWIGLRSETLQNALFYMLLPILAVLPFGDSFYLDKKSGYIKNVFIRTKKHYYYISKYIATFLSGAFVVAVPLLLDLAMTALIVPAVGPEPATAFFALGPLSMWNELFITAPYVYVFLYIAMTAVFAGLFAVICLAVTDLVDNRFAILLTPFLLYLFTKYVLSWLNLNRFSPYMFLLADQGLVPNITFFSIALEMLGLLTITVLLFIYRGTKNETY